MRRRAAPAPGLGFCQPRTEVRVWHLGGLATGMAEEDREEQMDAAAGCIASLLQALVAVESGRCAKASMLTCALHLSACIPER